MSVLYLLNKIVFFFISYTLKQFNYNWTYLVFEGLIQFSCKIQTVNWTVKLIGEKSHYVKLKDFFKKSYMLGYMSQL